MTHRIFGHALALLALCSLSAPAIAADNFHVTDRNSTDLLKCSKTQADTSQADCAALLPSENHIGEVGGRTAVATATMTTTSATTAWAPNQLIANSATAASVIPLSFTVCRIAQGSGMVRRLRLKVATDTGFAGQTLILKLYQTAPTTIMNGDRGTWLTSDNNYLGDIPVTLSSHMTDFEKGFGTPNSGNEINFDCAAGLQTIQGLLVSNGTMTPQAGTKVITAALEVLQN